MKNGKTTKNIISKKSKKKINKMQPSTAAKKILKRFSATNPDFQPTTRV